MSSNRKIAIIVGLVFLFQFFAEILVKQVLIGPETFGLEFIKTAAAQSNQIVLATFIGLLVSVLSVVVAAILFPIFKKTNLTFTILYLSFSIISFAVSAMEYFSVLSVLSLSREHAKAGGSSIEHIQTLAAVLQGNRIWIHLMALLISSLPLAAFYCLTYQSKLIPRFISVWGLFATGLLFAVMSLALFDKGVFLMLLIPLGLNQLFLCVWLLAKGFSSAEDISQTT